MVVRNHEACWFLVPVLLSAMDAVWLHACSHCYNRDMLSAALLLALLLGWSFLNTMKLLLDESFFSLPSLESITKEGEFSFTVNLFTCALQTCWAPEEDKSCHHLPEAVPNATDPPSLPEGPQRDHHHSGFCARHDCQEDLSQGTDSTKWLSIRKE